MTTSKTNNDDPNIISPTNSCDDGCDDENLLDDLTLGDTEEKVDVDVKDMKTAGPATTTTSKSSNDDDDDDDSIKTSDKCINDGSRDDNDDDDDDDDSVVLDGSYDWVLEMTQPKNVTCRNVDLPTFSFDMKIGANKAARAVAKPSIVKMIKVLKKEGFFEDPTGRFSKDLQPRKLRVKNLSVYFAEIQDCTGTVILKKKFGSTSRAKDRKEDEDYKNDSNTTTESTMTLTSTSTSTSMKTSDDGDEDSEDDSDDDHDDHDDDNDDDDEDVDLTVNDGDDDFNEDINNGLTTITLVCNVDMNNATADAEIVKIYDAMMDDIIESPKVHPFQKELFSTIRDRGGGDLGIKRKIPMMMIEESCALEKKNLGIPSPQEFLSLDELLCINIHTLADNYASEILAVLPDIIKKGAVGNDFFFWSLSSWKPGYVTGCSSNVLSHQCIVGLRVSDTLPQPPVRNATNVAERYDTSKYTRTAKAKGRYRLFRLLEELLSHDCGIILLDTNKLILDDDIGMTAVQVLMCFGFKLVLSVHKGEIFVLVHHSNKHAVLLHFPLCVASDPRSFITEQLQDDRGLTCAILCNTMRPIIRKKPSLTPQDVVENPIYGMLAMKIVKKGFHMGDLVASAFYREFVSPRTTFALVDNDLAKSSSTAISNRVRRQDKKDPSSTSSKVLNRQLESDIYIKARGIITTTVPSNATAVSPSVMKQLVKKLDALFSKDKNNRNFRTTDQKTDRWSKLFNKHIKPGTDLSRELKAARDATLQNTGNRKKGAGKALTNTQKGNNDDEMAKMVRLHRPLESGEEQGAPFWVPQVGKGVQTIPDPMTVSECGKVIFPDCHPVYNQLGLGALESRVQSKPSKTTPKNNTKHVKSTKYPELKILKQLSPKDNNTGIRVKNSNGKVFHLVAFGQTTSNTKSEKKRTPITQFFSQKKKKKIKTKMESESGDDEDDDDGDNNV